MYSRRLSRLLVTVSGSGARRLSVSVFAHAPTHTQWGGLVCRLASQEIGKAHLINHFLGGGNLMLQLQSDFV